MSICVLLEACYSQSVKFYFQFNIVNIYLTSSAILVLVLVDLYPYSLHFPEPDVFVLLLYTDW